MYIKLSLYDIAITEELRNLLSENTLYCINIYIVWSSMLAFRVRAPKASKLPRIPVQLIEKIGLKGYVLLSE